MAEAPGAATRNTRFQALARSQAVVTLSAQMKVLYVTGEESGAQIALRSRRLGLAGKQVRVLAEIPGAHRQGTHCAAPVFGCVSNRLRPAQL